MRRPIGIKLASAKGHTYGEPNGVWASAEQPKPGKVKRAGSGRPTPGRSANADTVKPVSVSVPVSLAEAWRERATRDRTSQVDVLLDAIVGDATLFIRRDEVEAAWALITPIMEGWAAGHAPKPAPYWPGTWGPEAADTLIERDGRAWRKL